MRRKSETRGDLNGFLDAGSHIQGELHFDDTFRIDGRLTGKIASEGELVVGDRGEIEGEIDVRRVYVSGIVRGSLQVADRLEISASGKVFADVVAGTLVVEEGAHLEGSCTMKRPGHADDQGGDGGATVARMPQRG